MLRSLVGSEMCIRDRYTGTGTTFRARHNVHAVLNYPGSGIRATDLNETAIQTDGTLTRASFDVLFVPGGGGTTISTALGPAGRRNVLGFVRDGGGYVGVCAGAFLAIQHLHISGFTDIPRPANSQRGEGNVTLALTASGTAQLAGFGVVPSAVASQLFFYANGPVMSRVERIPANVSQLVSLVNFSSSSVPMEKHYIGPEAGRGAVAVGANRFGDGNVLVSGPHPETNQMDWPKFDGPPSAPGSPEATLLQSYVKRAAISK
eukprot:TRINITY_DN57010_c0_g1_i1.p1 TRINITY_DN57010_c0_g1~~TRINITY_DN57010_c0_g1_i1.p1  ORF type:complete len:300 (-),score=40.71 TRINITY_DN57010_c0_g1_i1:277-1062(-)